MISNNLPLRKLVLFFPDEFQENQTSLAWFLNIDRNTKSQVDKLSVCLGVLFVLLVTGRNHFIDNPCFDGFHLETPRFSDHLVQMSKSHSQLREKVIFDVVLGSGWGRSYLCSKLLEMEHHLFPISECSFWSLEFYSWVQGCFPRFESDFRSLKESYWLSSDRWGHSNSSKKWDSCLGFCSSKRGLFNKIKNTSISSLRKIILSQLSVIYPIFMDLVMINIMLQ